MQARRRTLAENLTHRLDLIVFSDNRIVVSEYSKLLKQQLSRKVVSNDEN